MAPRAPRLARVARLVVPSALLLAAPLVCAGDLTVVARVRGGAAGAEQRTITYVSGGHVRLSGEHDDWIYDVQAGRTLILGLDARRGTYFETGLDEIAAEIARLDERIRTIPVLSSSIGEDGEVQVRREGGRRTVAGHACDEWVVSIGTANLLELCLAPGLARPDAWIDLMRASYASEGASGRRIVALLDALRRLEGYPLVFEVETRLRGRKTEIVTEAIEVRTDPLDAALFALPEGYTKVDSPFAAPGR